MRLSGFALVSLLAIGCGKTETTEKKEPPAPSVEPLPTTPPAMPLPVASAAGSSSPIASASSGPDGSASGDPRVSQKAREAALAGRIPEVRALLLPEVRAGRASPDDQRILRQACKMLRDQACLAEIPR